MRLHPVQPRCTPLPTKRFACTSTPVCLSPALWTPLTQPTTAHSGPWRSYYVLVEQLSYWAKSEVNKDSHWAAHRNHRNSGHWATLGYSENTTDMRVGMATALSPPPVWPPWVALLAERPVPRLSRHVCRFDHAANHMGYVHRFNAFVHWWNPHVGRNYLHIRTFPNLANSIYHQGMNVLFFGLFL